MFAAKSQAIPHKARTITTKASHYRPKRTQYLSLDRIIPRPLSTSAVRHQQPHLCYDQRTASSAPTLHRPSRIISRTCPQHMACTYRPSTALQTSTPFSPTLRRSCLSGANAYIAVSRKAAHRACKHICATKGIARLTRRMWKTSWSTMTRKRAKKVSS